MTAGGGSVLRPGDWVTFDGGEHQVVALAGTAVRLRSAAGAESVVLASYLMAAPDFAVTGAEPLPEMEPFGLLETLPEPARAAAVEWQRHVVEVETGLPPGAEPGTPARPEYDLVSRTVVERAQAKADELGVSLRTVMDKRSRYARQGLWGLVDQRLVRVREATGRADARVVAAIRQVLDDQTQVSTGTRSRVIRRVVKLVEATHGEGVVPLPSRNTFYRLIDTLSAGRHAFGSAVTRRQTANRPAGPFTPTFADRPGEQVQIDSTPLDVMVVLDSGVRARADLTIAVDVATRTICAAVLRPVGTKAVDASLLLARMLVPEPMRPGWSASLRMAVSRMPHRQLLGVDARMEQAAAKPVIVPDTVVIDGGKVFISDTFLRACERLGISVQRARPRTPTDKAIVEATFSAINTLFCQHLAGYTGRDVTRRGEKIEQAAVWTIPELQDLLEEWLLAGWQMRPHDALRDPFRPGKAMSPNDKYASLVAAAGYLPLVLRGEDYLELLPVAWRAINDYGIRIGHRTYDAPELGPWRRQHSGHAAKRGLWEVHYDPYDLTRVFVRTTGGWITAPWVHLPLVNAPFADFTWDHARRLAAAAGLDDANEADVARVLDALLTRAEHGPDIRTARVLGRTRTAAALPAPAAEPETENTPDPAGPDSAPSAEVVPFGVFDAHAEAERWL
ncbi:Mu transposase C-terminal domain-containing protein (plasmid) [Streptomyces sp. BHT-5-2]|uniref:Mu transposase C-terminal domain-containing protein n=1 Tax=Streptomyces sp. BHT-5-2 TaxID=2866715 RepID=UPI001C8D0C10|nr:Mu transposase C-terminal domain-containing protein [Streptomyces sp. BHT-5-2]QZL07933.1 Mu transposase C-terminal domain-containing protein [Streptomyces sp. BHT-5-2]